MLHILENLPEKVNEILNIVAIFNPDEEVGSPWSKYIQHRWCTTTADAVMYAPKAPSDEGAGFCEAKDWERYFSSCFSPSVFA